MLALVVDRMSSRAASPLEGVFRVHPAVAQVNGMGTDVDSTEDTSCDRVRLVGCPLITSSKIDCTCR